MFKKILVTFLLCFLLQQAWAQPSQYTPMTANGYQMKRVKVDSTLHIPSFCGGQPSLNGSTSSMGALAFDTCQNKLYKYNTEFGWTEVGPTDFIDTIFRRNDSVFAKKNGITYFQFKDSVGGGGPGSTPTLQQVLTAGSTVTSNNVITGTTRTTIRQTGTSTKVASLFLDTTSSVFSVTGTSNAQSNVTLQSNLAQFQTSATLTNASVVTTPTLSYLRFNKVFPSLSYNFGVSEQGAYWATGSGSYYFPIGSGTTGQVLKLTSPTQLAWADDSSGGSTIDTTSLSNRINEKIDSLKRSSDSVYAYKNGQWNFQFKDSVGVSAANDTAKVVIAKVHNATGTILQRGEVVYLSGANGDVASVKRANNKQDSTSSKTFGIVRRNIAIGDTGYITTQGQIEKLNLGSFNPGDILWLDSIDGQFTKTEPQAPYHSVFLGVVERANNGNGLMYVKPQNGYELGEIHDVQINSKLNNQILVYSDTQKVWKNRSVYSVVDTTSLSSRINDKYSTADTNKLQQKSLPAYSIMGNNTNAAANPTAVYYKDTSGTYTGTITWTPPGSAPSGATNHTYRWTRIGNQVTITISLVYQTAGTLLTQVVIALPLDAPTPVKPTGLTAASNPIYVSTFGASQTLTSGTLGNAPRSLMRNNAANNGFEFVSNFTGSTIITCFIQCQYTAQ